MSPTRSRLLSGVGVGVTVGALDAWLLSQTHERLLRFGLETALVVAAGLLVAAFVGRRTVRALVLVLAVSVMTGAWIGANSAHSSWFGQMVSHGNRSDRRVALTFDDGPNATATLAIRDELDAHGAKGTFFEVGKAAAARPDIVEALVRDGHLVANHSFHHDSYRWLDPRYPELDRTEASIDRVAGVCPAFFRPPHGQHTPFMAFVVHRRRMTMVGWDVSVADWAVTDPKVIARRVLQRVRPGSIIDLHDGLDGHVQVDRSSLARAMPAILDGLARRHLQPVRLDELLGRPGTLPTCPGRVSLPNAYPAVSRS